MKLSRFLSLVLAALLSAAFASAQPSVSSPSQSPRQFSPQGIDALRQGASSKTEFTLDHSMLILASKLDPDNEDLRRVIAGVSGISVHNFRYARPDTFDPQAIESVRDDYHKAGWMQVMNKQAINKQAGGNAGVTDLWVRLENNAISNAAILVARSREVDFVVISGSISPVDLSHLAGHFGIPKIEGGVEVPNTVRR
jgi:uncharacterized protein DUF4252